LERFSKTVESVFIVYVVKQIFTSWGHPDHYPRNEAQSERIVLGAEKSNKPAKIKNRESLIYTINQSNYFPYFPKIFILRWK